MSNRMTSVFHLVFFVHILEEGVVRAVSLHSVLEKFHRFYAIEVRQEFTHYPYAVCYCRGVKQIIATGA